MNVMAIKKKNPTTVNKSNTLEILSSLVKGENTSGKRAATMTPRNMSIQKLRPTSEK